MQTLGQIKTPCRHECPRSTVPHAALTSPAASPRTKNLHNLCGSSAWAFCSNEMCFAYVNRETVVKHTKSLIHVFVSSCFFYTSHPALTSGHEHLLFLFPQVVLVEGICPIWSGVRVDADLIKEMRRDRFTLKAVTLILIIMSSW